MNELYNLLINKRKTCLPIWFMRQAGRYLPEFRNIRLQNQDFIKLCLNSDLCAEITLQPLKRFDLDAAIIFSDILIVPYAMGQDVKFKKNYGPILSKINLDSFLNCSNVDFIKKLQPVYKAIRKKREKLNKKKSLISFVGSPWTLAVYILGLKKEKNILDLDKYKKKDKEINLILEKITNFLCMHIKNQIGAGADIVQIFDSWAGLMPQEDLNKFCYLPNFKLVKFCNANKIPVICFPKGIGKDYVNFLNEVKPDGLSIDYEIDPLWAKENLKGTCIQGGMDPKILLKDEKTIFKYAELYLKTFKDFPYIFNLGHGLLPETNPDKVFKLVNFIKNYKND